MIYHLGFALVLATVCSGFGRLPLEGLPLVLHPNGTPLIGRVIGGQYATISDVPYQAALFVDFEGYKNYKLNCGGSIITNQVIISAAHCVYKIEPERVRVRIGTNDLNSGGYDFGVFDIIMHEKYKRYDYDVSLLLLSKVLRFEGAQYQPVPLPSPDAVVPIGYEALVSGWGALQEGGKVTTILQKVLVPIIDKEICKQAYMGLTARMLCAGFPNGGHDACQGDSGGPLTINGVLFGVSSFGSGCGRAGFPGVYASVPALRRWIDKKIDQF